jgi:hypothetical protein
VRSDGAAAVARDRIRLQAIEPRQLTDPEDDPILLRAGKLGISAKQPIPHGKDSAEIGVRFVI